MKSLKKLLKWYFNHCSAIYEFTPTGMIPLKKDQNQS